MLRSVTLPALEPVDVVELERAKRLIAVVDCDEILQELEGQWQELEIRRLARIPSGRGNWRPRCGHCHSFLRAANEKCKKCGWDAHTGWGD